ncbi:hypothetical protein A2673_02125 [Candidatus Kaiserbacteria bacterium RIFCSPHIGHO2_01_FULL_50_13]|uniref:Uncharacterized protein n=1 Tax=Candidatus Kaiserbacteria bacterium RIFCSPLOWO2_01_FULL_50_24 TaxID=1798507 RepID=A0A1F6ER49_9BACT|nr:MAG: hypothetical protein A2673_02125 [Candidatus Kaiserbacteria bacterium RIFCSPHIGHO2_01_FULL_50_13]OGG76118.1 MAG: hypothetical protein A3A34_00845 [Candidatus Kaiserbacteria bacterium RIFCSPLOWO2_01_FULL_50_24]OGG82351.1 MAG: hypothetical protein A3H74_00075 [Candidatus Kaiserbacteria bacterium RIFCSPLOWO2_02_FULL_51_13]
MNSRRFIIAPALIFAILVILGIAVGAVYVEQTRKAHVDAIVHDIEGSSTPIKTKETEQSPIEKSTSDDKTTSSDSIRTSVDSKSERTENALVENLDSQMAGIEKQLQGVVDGSGGIHPDTRLDILAKLSELQALDANTERIATLRALLEKLEVGSAGDEESQDGGGEVTTGEASQSSSAIPSEPSCVSNSNPVFTHHITDTTMFSQIKPPPNKTPEGDLKPHSYIETHGQRVPVYAPVDMTLIGGAYFEGGPYGLDFRVSCEVRLRFGHISEPVEVIREVFPDRPAPAGDSRDQKIKHEVSFKAGDLLAYTVGTNPGAGNWDFGVYNSNVKNRYADDPKYNWSDINTTAVCPYGYFTEELLSVYKSKYDFSGYGALIPDGESFCE